MAIVQATQFDKNIRHLNKKFKIILNNLAASKLLGRINGPIILSNSIPKSGTHLLENFLESIPVIRNAGTKTLSIKNEKDYLFILRYLQKMKNGAFYNAHLYWDLNIINEINNKKIKVLFLIRDPRDIVVSRYKYISLIDKLHPGHKQMLSLKDNSERLFTSIVGIKNVMPSIKDVLTRFLPWLSEKNIFICRFEDLIGEQGGGNNKRQNKVLKDILNFIEISLDEKKISYIQKKAFSRKSSTFRKGKIGSWKYEFNSEHIDLFKHEVGGLLHLYGYRF